MIREVEFLDPKKAVPANSQTRFHASWAWDMPAIKALGTSRRRIKLEPGLTVLFGKNGSGKSTVLSSIAHSLAALQGGRSVVTQDWVRTALYRPMGASAARSVPATCARIMHDGQGVIYAAAGKTVGLDMGHFDDDFFAQGVMAVSDRGKSAGEMNITTFAQAFGTMEGRVPFPAKIERRVKRGSVNDLWRETLDVAEARLLKPHTKRGQPTILLDEPDAHLSFAVQSALWKKLLGSPEIAARFQIIVATHSPFALMVPHAHIVEMSDGFVAETRKAIKHLAA